MISVGNMTEVIDENNVRSYIIHSFFRQHLQWQLTAFFFSAYDEENGEIILDKILEVNIKYQFT